MDPERYHRASALESLPWSKPPRGRVLTDGEIRALFGACEADPPRRGP